VEKNEQERTVYMRTLIYVDSKQNKRIRIIML